MSSARISTLVRRSHSWGVPVLPPPGQRYDSALWVWPSRVYRISGSRVRLPATVTVLMVVMVFSLVIDDRRGACRPAWCVINRWKPIAHTGAGSQGSERS